MRKFNVVVNGKSYTVDVEEIEGEAQNVAMPTAAAPVAPVRQNVVSCEGTPVKAPMPGLILSLARADGDAVKQNDKVLVLEAMKMENDVNAPVGGTITYAVKKGDNVETGTVLAYIK